MDAFSTLLAKDCLSITSTTTLLVPVKLELVADKRVMLAILGRSPPHVKSSVSSSLTMGCLVGTKVGAVCFMEGSADGDEALVVGVTVGVVGDSDGEAVGRG